MQPEPQKIGANRGNAGKGRPKGAPNKITTSVKEAILAAANAAHPEGVIGYLTEQASANPTAFMTLLGKIVPTQSEITGKDGGPIETKERGTAKLMAYLDAVSSRAAGQAAD